MYTHRPHNKIIEGKLEELPGADTDALWNNMEAILDKKMPQKKRRPGILGWFWTNKGWMLVSIAVAVSVVGYSVVYTANNKPIASNHPFKINTSTKKKSLPGSAPAATVTPAMEADKATALISATETIETQEVNTQSKATPVATATSENNSTVINTPAAVVKEEQVLLQQTSAPVVKRTAEKNHALKVNSTTAEQKEQGVTTSYTASSRAVNSIAINHEDHAAETAAQDLLTSLVPDSAAFDNNSVMNCVQSQLEAVAAATAAQKRGRVPSEKGPYIGLMVGVDMSSVGLKTMKAGSNKGLILGYAFNNRWSVESGLYWNKKKYYAAGENFKPDGYTPDPNTTILNVTGINSMYEWPVNVKYTVLPGRHKLFVTAGVSSYFMKEESYNYQYEQNGQLGEFYANYKNGTKNWFSIANLSVGYTHRLGAIGSIRVEPYLKLPISELGLGNMKVMSTGLNIGLTRALKQ